MPTLRICLVIVLCSGLFSTGCAIEVGAAVDPTAEALEAGTRPVVVVAGLMEDEATVAPLADAIRAHGTDVTVWVPPNIGFDDIHGYALQLSQTVEEVRSRTSAAQVNLVGHSEGGVTSRRYLKDLGGAAPVHTFVSLGSPQQGTEGGVLSLVLRVAGCEIWATACQQLVAGSDFLAELNSGDATPGPVRYVTIASHHDQVVQPVTRAGILGAENLVVQDICAERAIGHFGLLDDAWVHDVVLSVLAGGPPTGDCSAKPVGSGI